MLLRQMKYFVSVADNKSFSEAGVECFISQSAISRQIKALEDELEVELIRRSNRRFQLTSAGEYFYAQSRKIMQEVNTIKHTVKQIEQHERGLFRLGCLSGYNFVKVCTAVNELLANNESLNIEIFWGEHEELLAKLQRQELEMVLCDLRPQEDYASLVEHSLSEEPLWVAISARSPLAKQDYIDVAQLENLQGVLITVPKDRENTEKYYQSLMNYFGNFITPPQSAAAFSYIINNLAFMPMRSKDASMEGYNAFIKVLPLQRDNEPILIKYAILYKDDELLDNCDRVQRINQNRIKSLLLDKLLP